MQEAFQTWLPPALCAADGLDHLFRFAAVVNKNDAFFIQGKGKAEFVSSQIFPVGDLKGPGQRVIVDLRFGVVNIPGIQIQIDPHIEALPFPLPFRRCQNGNKLRRLISKNSRLRTRLYGFF